MVKCVASITVAYTFVFLAAELGHAFTRDRNIIALIAEGPVYAFTRDRKTAAHSANQAAKARRAAAKAAARGVGA